jgi:hypothetical protein
MTIKQKYDNYRKLNLQRLGLLALDYTKQKYLDNQREQMLHGEDNQGANIGEYQSKAYAEMKNRMNALADGYVDLKLTGSFQDKLDIVKRGSDKFEVLSRDKKNGILVEKYGSKIFLLNDKYLQNYRLSFMPKFVEILKNETNKE